MNMPSFFRHVCMLALLIPLLSGCAGGTMYRGPEAPEQVAFTEPSRIPWLSPYEALDAPARTQDRMFILYFTKTSCAPCAMMEKWTFTDATVAAALRAFIPVKISGNAEQRMIQRYRVRMFPTVIFAKGWDTEIDRKAGYRSADFVLQWIENVKANHMTISALKTQLRHNPTDIAALLAQARNFTEAGETREALALAQKAAELSPEDPNVFALLGLCYLRGDRLDEAEEAIAEALRLDENNEDATHLQNAVLLKKADAALEEGDLAGARELYSAAIQATRGNYDAHMGMGRACMSDKQYDKAFEAFQRAAELRLNSPAPIVALGNYYQEIGDDQTAERQFLRAVDVEPRYEAPYFRLIELYERQGKRDAIMETYEKVLPLEPAGAHNEIAWIMATSKHPNIHNPEAAIRHANIAVEVEPHPWYIDTLAEAYYAKGDYDLAIAIIKEAMAEEPDDIRYYQEQLEKFLKAKKDAGENGEPERE